MIRSHCVDNSNVELMPSIDPNLQLRSNKQRFDRVDFKAYSAHTFLACLGLLLGPSSHWRRPLTWMAGITLLRIQLRLVTKNISRLKWLGRHVVLREVICYGLDLYELEGCSVVWDKKLVI